MLALRVARIFDGRELLPGAGVVFVDGDRIVGVEPAGFDVPGQVDHLRAAHHNADGTAVVALPAGSAHGGSRVVPRLAGGVVTTLKSDVDVVVTEWGVADIRACSVSERVERLIAVARPDHRVALAASRPTWL